MEKAILLLLTLNSLSASVLCSQRFERSLNTSDHVANVKGYEYFLQKLDHFHRGNDLRWQQRFFTVEDYYKPGGPIFLLVNDKSSVDENFDVHYGGQWMSYAKELNAACFLLEHRFYAKTWPKNGDMIRHLSSEQALADMAYFIQYKNKMRNFPQDTKWIAFGSSYTGSLAAWARLKYPHLIYGAVASSAPILAQADFSEYLHGVEKSLNSYDSKCFRNLVSAGEEIYRLKKTMAGKKKFTETFGACPNQKYIITGSCLEDLFLGMKNTLIKAVEFHHTATVNISTVCDAMIKSAGTEYQKYAKLMKQHNITSYGNKDDDDDEEETNYEPWDFLRCSQFGFFQGTQRDLKLFAGQLYDSVQHVMKKKCAKFFGPNYTMKDLNEKVRRTNMMYGGLKFNVGNTLFVHGSLDPWHVLGIYEKKNDSLYQTIFIKGTSHGADQLSASDGDIQELKDARKEILEILKVWLKKKSE